ncbi:hypothetical protein MRX96_048502 [Rhipicephalus microplus]
MGRPEHTHASALTMRSSGPRTLAGAGEPCNARAASPIRADMLSEKRGPNRVPGAIGPTEPTTVSSRPEGARWAGSPREGTPN